MGDNTRKYHKSNCITFRSTKGKYGALSNMAPGFPVRLGETYIGTVEALYQSLKFTNFPKIQEQIINFASPIQAKKYSRINDEKVRSDWKDNKFKVMKFCLDLKLSQNPESFGNILLSTNNLSIVEFTYNDLIWGAISQGEYYYGINALGRLLMQLRESIKTDQKEIAIPEIENFSFLGKSITKDMLIK